MAFTGKVFSDSYAEMYVAMEDSTITIPLNKVIDEGACGGEWSEMAMSAIKRGLPDIFKKMKDKEYDFFELLEIIADNIIEVR